MTIRERTIATLKCPIAPEPFSMGEVEDRRPAIARILEGLMQKAANGDVPAAREIREYLALKTEL
jgi:hypothetical protein